MLKEIHEQPRALRDTLSGRLQNHQVWLEGVDLTPAEAAALEKIVIIACGTARHAGMVGKYLIENYLRLPVEDDVASEFRYRNPILNERTLGLVISQSGETADTLAGLLEAQKSGEQIYWSGAPPTQPHPGGSRSQDSHSGLFPVQLLLKPRYGF
jgi:glucosamine--fructose-6-phosphate aminotransferase (isomerizing)